MVKQYLPIDTGYYTSTSKPIADQILENWYLDYPETQTVTPAQSSGATPASGRFCGTETTKS